MIYRPSIMNAIEDSEIVMDEACKNWSGYFGKYSPFYHIATEDVPTYINNMEPIGTTALTIGASGDQGIALTKKGAKELYFFDLNRADVYWLMLKKTAFENLKRKDFLDFMIAESNGEIIDYRLYQKIRNQLDAATRTFWDNLYTSFRYNNRLMSIHLFRDTKKYNKNVRMVNDFLFNNQAYYETQRQVKDSNWYFIESDFFELEQTLPQNVSFDAIVLSNIYEYINFGNDVSVENAKKYLEFIKNVLIPRLNQNGTCMSAYLYRFDESTNDFIKQQLETDPNGWIPSSDFLSGLSNIEKFFTGYTGQNVAYHYLYEEMQKEPNVQKVKTRLAGFGMSNAPTDLALIQKK